jgi:phosphoglycerate dehydrogenase-like enzyme
VEHIKVIVTSRFNDAQLDRLRAVSPRLVIVSRRVAEGWGLSDTSDFFEGDEEIFYGFMPPRTLSKVPHLKWVQLHSAGVNHLNDHPIMQSHVQITTSSGIHAVPIGEFAIMMMLALARRVPRMVRMQDQGEWPKERFVAFAGSELRGKTLGVVGYGSIGREAARIAKVGFGMRILALTRAGMRKDLGYVERGIGDPEGKIPDAWFSPQQLVELLSQSDYVLVTAPLTNETRNMIGEAGLRAMKPNAYIINVSRGGIIEENALVRALKEHWIAGAGLDVFATEPLPATSELWKLENALISPHVSGASPTYDDRAVDVFVENLKRYLNGDHLLNLVDKSLGY